MSTYSSAPSDNGFNNAAHAFKSSDFCIVSCGADVQNIQLKQAVEHAALREAGTINETSSTLRALASMASKAVPAGAAAAAAATFGHIDPAFAAGAAALGGLTHAFLGGSRKSSSNEPQR